MSSIYMIPLKDLTAQNVFSNLEVAHERADHVIVWYVSSERAAQLAK